MKIDRTDVPETIILTVNIKSDDFYTTRLFLNRVQFNRYGLMRAITRLNGIAEISIFRTRL